jgi:hypothetical protein
VEDFVYLKGHLFFPVKSPGSGGLAHLDPGDVNFPGIEPAGQFFVKEFGNVFRGRILLRESGQIV